MQKIIALVLLAVSANAYSQQAPGNVTEKSYGKTIEASGDLYYGIEHTGYPQKLKGFAYFQSAEWQKGSVCYNNVVYNNISLKYDLVSDELIVLHPNNFFSVTLYSEKVQWFTIGDQRFIYIPKKNEAGLKPGFYHQLITGNITVLVKRTKIIEEKTTADEVEKSIAVKDQFFALKNGAISHISNEESLLQLTGDEARKIRALLRSKEIKFRKEKELAIIEIATYYNQQSAQ